MKNSGVRIVHSAVKLFGRLPLGFHYAAGGFLSWVAKNVLRYRRDVVMTNIARSFPDRKYKEIVEISDRFYSHFGDIFAEAIWFGASSAKRLYGSDLVTVTNPEVMNRSFRQSPSVTVLFSHCGNWEIIGGLLVYRTSTGERLEMQAKDVKVVYKRLHSKFSNEFFLLNRIAPLGPGGEECEVETEDILRYSMRRKNEKTVYIYIADQYPYHGAYPIGEFMHQPTKAMLGSVKLAHKLGHSVLYLGMKAVERGRYELTFETICDDASALEPEVLARKYFDLLERDINETPHNWLWSHKRWK